MKTKALLLSISIVLVLNIYSQQFDKFVSRDTVEIRKLGDSIAYNAKTKFKFIKSEYSKYDRINYFLTYTENGEPEIKTTKRKDSNGEATRDEVLPESKKMIVTFRVKYIGENKDLEIKGIPEYRFERVEGKFLNLYPFWKKYINPNADAIKLTEDGAAKRDEVFIPRADGRKISYCFIKQFDIWTIILNVYN